MRTQPGSKTTPLSSSANQKQQLSWKKSSASSLMVSGSSGLSTADTLREILARSEPVTEPKTNNIPANGVVVNANNKPQVPATYYRSILYEILIAGYYAALILSEQSDDLEDQSPSLTPSSTNTSAVSRITLYSLLFIVSELIKTIYTLDCTDPLNLKPFKKMLIIISYVLKANMVYLLVRLAYNLQSVTSLFLILHFGANDLLVGVAGKQGYATHQGYQGNVISSTSKSSTVLLGNSFEGSSQPNNNNSSSHSTPSTTVTSFPSFLPLSLSPSKILELFNPFLLYCFCKTIRYCSQIPTETMSTLSLGTLPDPHTITMSAGNNQIYSGHQYSSLYGLSNLSLLFLIFFVINLVISSEVRMVLQGERCWLLGRRTTIVVMESLVGPDGAKGSNANAIPHNGSASSSSSNNNSNGHLMRNVVEKITISYDKSEALKTMVMGGCLALMLENFLLIFESVQEEISMAIVHSLILTASAQYLYMQGRKSVV